MDDTKLSDMQFSAVAVESGNSLNVINAMMLNSRLTPEEALRQMRERQREKEGDHEQPEPNTGEP